jgi:DNA topoisomerase II
MYIWYYKMTKYTKYSHLEHILARPDTYVGTVGSDASTQWVPYTENDQLRMVEKRVTHVAALLKIFDEILVNAIDHSVDPTNKVDKISVIINDNEISVMNTCKGIPIEKQTGTDTWIPEMIFGELLTSSNYDDTEERITGGRNGYGAKLTNVFSSFFELDVANSEMKQRYIQTWTKNMTIKSSPKITKYSKSDNFQTRFGKI